MKPKTKPPKAKPEVKELLQKARLDGAEKVKHRIHLAQRLIAKAQRALQEAGSITVWLIPLPTVVPMRKKKAGTK